MSILILDKVEVPPDAPDGLWVMIRKMVDPFASLRSMEGVAVIDGADRKRSREGFKTFPLKTTRSELRRHSNNLKPY